MLILITGGAGFIGSNLCKTLVGEGHDFEVRVLDDLSTGNLANLKGLDVEFIEGSILDFDLLRRVSVGVDSIVHLGAVPSVPRSVKDPRRSHDVNATGTLNVLEAARCSNVEQVIVASSSSVYGSNPVLPKKEDTWTRPMSPYAATKLLTESYALAYQQSYGLSAMAFRFFNVYGPGQDANHDYAAVIPRFIDRALKREALLIEGDGNQSRDFTYVDTLCAVLHSAISEKSASHSPINLAYGTNTSLNELVSIIEDEVGEKLTREYRDARVGDVHTSQADGQRVRELYPEVEPTRLKLGIQQTVEWFRDAGRSAC